MEDKMNGSAEGAVQLQEFSASNSQGSNEKAHLVEKDETQKNREQLRFKVLFVSWTSVIVLALLGVITLVFAFEESSSASFAFALDAFLDCLSSLVVIWRYSGTTATLFSTKRERLACILLGVFFLVSSCTIIVRAVISLVDELLPGQADSLWILALVNGLSCTVLMLAKAYLAHKLQSISLATDAVNSAIGAVLAYSTLISEQTYAHNRGVWYVDPTIGVICATFLMVYGAWLIIFELKFNKHEPVDTKKSAPSQPEQDGQR